MSSYSRLTLAEREEISRLLAKGIKFSQIARMLCRHVSTVSREVNRNDGRQEYRSFYAQMRAQHKSRLRRRRRKLDSERLYKTVAHYLSLRWSPEQVAKKLIILYSDDQAMQVSHETIYKYIYIHPRPHLRRQLLFYLRRKHKYRRVKKSRMKTSPIQDYISIDQRPIEANDRKVPGHWEGDLIVGTMNASAIGTLVERTTRYTVIVKLRARDAVSVRKAFEKKFNGLPEHLKRSLTYDHGQEMAQHKEFTKNSRINVYFANPHSPWERGTCENTNMLIRDFLPKGTDFSKVPASKLQHIQNLLNDRPRKVLNWLSPNEVYAKFALAT